MTRILLVDDSPHAQRIGERILADEGFEVVTVSNGDSALIRLDDVSPDVVLVKGQMPGRSGFEICRYVKMSPRHRHVRVILTEGATETLDEPQLKQCGADGTLKKPFEASLLLDAVRPLAAAAAQDKATAGLPLVAASTPAPKPEAKVHAPMIAVIDPEQVRAAITVALDAVMAAMVDEITDRVMATLTSRRQGLEKVEPRSVIATAPAQPLPASAPLPEGPAASPEVVRHVTRAAGTAAASPRRLRAGSILGLNLTEPESPGEP